MSDDVKPEPARTAPRRFPNADFLTELFNDPLDPAYVAAAQERARRGPLPRWRRSTRKAAAVVTMLAIGFLFATAYQQVVAATPAGERTRQSLIEEIQGRQKHTDELAAAAEGLQGQVDVLSEEALSDTAVQQLREVQGATGLRKIIGDGVVVKLSDGPTGPVDDKARVLDYDLQRVVNALWAAGAEGIAINGQRLTSVTPIRKAGGVIKVGNRSILGPYEVLAVGSGDLEDDFNDSALAETMRGLHDNPVIQLGFEVIGRDDITLPAAIDPDLIFATVPGASPSTSATPNPTSSPSGGGK
jgi:uncharacterized protein YlxW (UPF0749 family)